MARSVATKATGHKTERVYRRYAIVSDAELQEAATGHKTERVYRRYAIVSDAELQEAARKLAGTIAGPAAPALDSRPATLHHSADESR